MAEDANNITDTNQDPTPDGGKTFTQADVDRIVADRLSRERKNQPSAERLKAFEEWENRLGRIEEWGDDLYDFVETVTGDTVETVELDKQMLLIRYTK